MSVRVELTVQFSSVRFQFDYTTMSTISFVLINSYKRGHNILQHMHGGIVQCVISFIFFPAPLFFIMMMVLNKKLSVYVLYFCVFFFHSYQFILQQLFFVHSISTGTS